MWREEIVSLPNSCSTSDIFLTCMSRVAYTKCCNGWKPDKYHRNEAALRCGDEGGGGGIWRRRDENEDTLVLDLTW